MKNTEEKQQESFAIFSAKLARQLLRDGFRIVDVQPNKQDVNRTVFIFEYHKDIIPYLEKK